MDIKELNSFKLSDAVKFHDKLNPKLWRGDRLDPAVKKQLLLIAEDFIQELGIDSLDVADITVSGSNAAYTYTPHSDFDLHILVDMSKLPSSEVYKELFHAKKMLYNDSHDISIHGVPIELYVQDTNEPVVSLGEYSILNDKWIKRPTKRRANLDQNLTREKFDRLKELVLLALETRDIDRINKTLKTIKRYRQAGLDKGGEFSPENLAFKAIRKQGGIQKLYDLRDKLHSEMLTIENMYAIPESKKLDKPTMSVEELAKKHGVSRMDIARQLDKGVKVELEHTSDRKVAREIALDHLAEDPRYYDKLSSVDLEEAKSNSITVYHGNQGGIDTDKLYMPMWFSSDYESVLHYTGGDGFVVVAELTPKKTLVIDKKSGIDINTAKENWRKLIAQGYDTIVQDYGDMQDWVVLDPNSIRVVDKISVDEELDDEKLSEADLKKNKWSLIISDADKDAWGKELIELVNNAYMHTSLGSFVQDLYAVKNSEWSALDWDNDPDIDCTVFFRGPRANETWKGYKVQGLGHDGNPESKQKVIDKLVASLSRNGVWVESSDALAKTLAKRGAVPVTDEKLCRAIFPGTNLKMLDKNTGLYQRRAGDRVINEIIYGKPVVSNTVTETTFAGKDPMSFKSPNGGTPTMLLVTGQGSRYLMTSDGMVLRNKSFHASTGGEDQGMKDWSGAIEFYEPNEKPGGVPFALSVGKAVEKKLPVALSNTKDGKRALMIYDGKQWRVAKISDIYKNVASTDAPIVATYSKSPKLNWNVLDYDVDSSKRIVRAHPGSPVTHGISLNKKDVTETEDLHEASGYIPSNKEKNDSRFKTALTVDVKPDSIKKNAKAFNWKTSRAGIPPEANTNGLVESKINEAFNQCYIEAQKLYDLAVEKKLKPQLVQVAGYKSDTDNANDKWKELPPHVWHHYVVIVGDTVLDPTAKQFGDDKPTKYSKEQLDANWAEQYVIKPNTLNQIDEALKPSQYRGIVKDWDKSRYAEIFSKYPDRDRNAYRIYLPLPVSKTPTKSSVAPEVEKHLATKGYTIKDYANGMATDGRREMRIGKLLSDTPEVAKKFVNDPARAASRQAQQMVVISRHPYDIAGMSTDRGWNSCMNLKDGAFANYVPIDVKEGTIVAYLINANDRNIENPVARIAIKPFVNTLNPDEVLFGAENRVYGTSSPAFKSAVVKWVNQVNKARGLEGVFIFNRKLYSDSDNKPKIQFKDKQVTAQMKMIMQNPSSIKTIPNPSEALQLAAVNLLSATIGFIENPTEKVQIAAVSKYGPAIRYIDNPSEAVQLAAVENNGHAIEYIENPSEKVQLAAVRQNGYALESIKDPSDEVKIEALKRTGNALQLIDNPTEEMKMVAVSRNGLAINHIQDPSEELKLAAVTNYGPALEYISNPSEEVQLAAIKQNENAIRFIDDPSEKVQLAAVSTAPFVIDYIKNPTEKVKQLYNRKMRDEIDAQK